MFSISSILTLEFHFVEMYYHLLLPFFRSEPNVACQSAIYCIGFGCIVPVITESKSYIITESKSYVHSSIKFIYVPMSLLRTYLENV